MVDNFQLLKPLLQFDNPGDFYLVQMLKRRKDNPDMASNMVNVDNFYIRSLNDYEQKEEMIKNSAKIHNARAYIRVNRRNEEKIALFTMSKIANYILSKDYKSVKNAYLSAAGEFNSEPIKRWIVDIDLPEEDFQLANHNADIIERTIRELHTECNRNSKQGEYKILLNVPTKNGYHIITNPFNLQKFRQMLTLTLDIHKDNPTILYML